MSDGGGVRWSCYQYGVGCQEVKGSVDCSAKRRLAAASANRRNTIRPPQVFEFRVTKYDPKFRAPSGAYTREEWTSVGDVGRTYGGVAFTREDYERTEGAYLRAAKAFLDEASVGALVIRGLEDRDARYPEFSEGAVLPVKEIQTLLALVLREKLWCRLEAPDTFVHIGYDFYMYIGVPGPCPFAQRMAVSLGLFVEPFRSPYNLE